MTSNKDYYEALVESVQRGEIIPDDSRIQRNPTSGRDAILAATGASTFEEAAQVALGRPRVGEEATKPSPSVRTRVPHELKRQLEDYARRHNQSASEVMRQALASYLRDAA